MGQGLPRYSYVPGGPWPHPKRARDGERRGDEPYPPPIVAGDWLSSAAYLEGIALFNAGYYWESHEVWEGLWHAHGRHGPEADLLKALIKLAAAGVKVREGQPRGVVTHAGRARDLFESVAARVGPRFLGLDLPACADFARAMAEHPPSDPAEPGAPVSRVFLVDLSPA